MFGHDEECYHRRERHTIARHDQVVQALAKALISLYDRVQVEPRTFQEGRRNDIRLPGSAAREGTAVDYDLKAYCLMAANAPSTATRKPEETSTLQHAVDQCNKYLVERGEGG